MKMSSETMVKLLCARKFALTVDDIFVNNLPDDK